MRVGKVDPSRCFTKLERVQISTSYWTSFVSQVCSKIFNKQITIMGLFDSKWLYFICNSKLRVLDDIFLTTFKLYLVDF